MKYKLPFSVLLFCTLLFLSGQVLAWYNSSWHYKVPVVVPAGASINSTIKVDVDFAALLTTLSVTGSFDINSPRIVRSDDITLATTQEFTDAIYAGATDAVNNSRGEIRFLLEDAGATTYYLYFDISANGPKTANTQTRINGNFEPDSSGTRTPSAWLSASRTRSSMDQQIRPNETKNIQDSYGSGLSANTNGNANTGSNSYLMGYRTNEDSEASATATLKRTIRIPSSNPGTFNIRIKPQGWDSNEYDTIKVQLLNTSNSSVLQDIAGPNLNNYATCPYSSNYSVNHNQITSSSPGYGRYNYWDNGSGSNNHTLGMAATYSRGAEVWINCSASLTSLAGQTVTLQIQVTNIQAYRSWFLIDDIEWSVIAGTLGTPQSNSTIATANHIRLIHTGTGVTCAAGVITIQACLDSNCTSLYTGSTTVSLSSTTGTWSSNPITFTGGSTTANLSVTTAGNVTIGATASSPAITNATRCFAGTTETCVINYGDSGFQFFVPDHIAETSQTISITAVQKASGSSTCSSAFSSSKAIKFTCSYQNPATGTLPVRIASLPLNAANNNSSACDDSGKTMNVSFNSSGVGSATLQYADVGQMSLTASYTGSSATGDAGLVMTGSDNFITAPASFGFSAISAMPIKAGSPFSSTVTALNSAGNATPNFGKESTPESVTLTHQLVSPTGTGAFAGTLSPGVFSSFSAGSASNSSISFSEVGVIKLIGTLTSGNYLVSGFNATGTSANIGDFVPHHFDTSISEGCNSFTYSGQPFTSVVLARNASGVTTLNYDGSANTSPNFAKLVTLSEGGTSLGSFNPATIALTSFNAGEADISSAFTYTVLQSPTHITVRVSDVNASSLGFTEGQIYAYSGRVNLQNAFGSELVDLPVPMTVEYYDGKNFITNTIDSCSGATLSLANSGASDSLQPADSCVWDDLSQSGASRCNSAAPAGSSYHEAGSLANGSFNVNLKKPAKTGSLKLQASVANWLQFNWQGTGNSDPSALVNFGLFKGNSKIIYFREVY